MVLATTRRDRKDACRGLGDETLRWLSTVIVAHLKYLPCNKIRDSPPQYRCLQIYVARTEEKFRVTHLFSSCRWKCGIGSKFHQLKNQFLYQNCSRVYNNSKTKTNAFKFFYASVIKHIHVFKSDSCSVCFHLNFSSFFLSGRVILNVI